MNSENAYYVHEVTGLIGWLVDLIDQFIFSSFESAGFDCLKSGHLRGNLFVANY